MNDTATNCPHCNSEDIDLNVELIEDELFGERCAECGQEWNLG